MSKPRTVSAYLREHAMTQRELARRLGISQAYLSQILAGIRTPSLSVAIEIERQTGVSVRTLAGVTR